ncbi:MAG: hypothetical protein QXT27_05125 [Pyrobaculum sp.]
MATPPSRRTAQLCVEKIHYIHIVDRTLKADERVNFGELHV